MRCRQFCRTGGQRLGDLGQLRLTRQPRPLTLQARPFLVGVVQRSLSVAGGAAQRRLPFAQRRHPVSVSFEQIGALLIAERLLAHGAARRLDGVQLHGLLFGSLEFGGDRCHLAAFLVEQGTHVGNAHVEGVAVGLDGLGAPVAVSDGRLSFGKLLLALLHLCQAPVDLAQPALLAIQRGEFLLQLFLLCDLRRQIAHDLFGVGDSGQRLLQLRQ